VGPYKKDSQGNEVKQYIPLNAENLLLRGCMLRNTEFVYGVVIFTGHNTKIMQNSSSGKYKFSALEILTSKSIFLILCLQVCFALTSGLIGGTWITTF
jgi:magnesium-transporting ATPase (P-type)